MKIFPKNAKFCFPWRSYQEQVLKDLELHLDDNHLNIVAAPGSGKTILGLEVMLRINKPTLILTPSIAIRNQWITRFTENFLQISETPKWISDDVNNPEFLTVSTYQGLHTAFTNSEEKDEEGEEEIDTIEEDEDEDKKLLSQAEIILKKLKQKNIQTIVIDEAHHLRNAWWKSLIYLKENIEKPHIVALTATPPYDVNPQEWKNYQNLCGPIDAEISVPELVAENNLCPHQDFVFLNSLSREENSQVKSFRENIKMFLSGLETNSDFIEILKNHPCTLDPQKNIEAILENPAYFSSIAIFLHKTGIKISSDFFKILGGSRWRVPSFSPEWAEILLENFLYHDVFITKNQKDFLTNLKRELNKIGAIEKGNIFLKNNSNIKRLLKESLNKLNSILEIVKIEHQNLQNNLRMVILTDFIRSEFFPKKDEQEKSLSRIGVIPIFEKIRREFSGTQKIGILSGSIVVIPLSAQKSLEKVAEELEIPGTHLDVTNLTHDENFLKVKIKGENNQKIVHLITEIFGRGEIEILVGTKSLLGEGWDAPSINTLILASFVGSFMLSNQMRGRAIRVDKQIPNKISNIWHLATVEKDNLYAGHDFEMLKRRFKAFVGISMTENSIENGFERMEIGMPPFSEKNIKNINEKIILFAQDRDSTKEKWKKALESGEIKKIIPEIKTEKERLPRKFIFFNTIFALFWRSLLAGVFFFLQTIQGLVGSIRYSKNEDLERILSFLGILIGISLLISLPGLLKSLWLFLRNGPIAGNMKQIGNTLLKTLCKINAIKTDVNKLRVITQKNKYGEIFCGLEGGTSYEKSLFLDCLEEIVSPIENPRYILTRESKLILGLREDFHTVPKIIGAHKESAEFFALMWNKYVGPNTLIYTRNIIGRQLLLNARQKAMSSSFQKRSERIDTWK